MKKLSLGSGLQEYEGYITIDINPLSKADIIHDLNVLPWPFEDNEFDEVLGVHVIEHLDNIPAIMDELWRITKSTGIIKLSTPHYTCVDSWTDPTHKHHLTSFSFDFWGMGYYSKAKFETSVLLTFKWITKRTGMRFLINHFRWCRCFWERYLSFVFRAEQIKATLKPIKD